MSHEVVKWYTRARKFPQLIGRTHDGARIPGGPYTYTQFIGGFIVLFVGVNTMSLWARFGLVSNVALAAAVSYGTVWLLGRVPIGSRNPLSVAAGFARAISRPRLGTVSGRPPRTARPRQLRHRVIVEPGAPPPRPAPPSPAPAQATGPTGRALPLSGVQQQLAAGPKSPRGT